MLKKILLFALILRIAVSFLGEHGDVVAYYWWGQDLLKHGLLGFYDRNIVNAVRPIYPPVTTYLFLLAAYIHQVVYQFFWFLNVRISLFPSGLINWMESDHGWYFFNKLPAIFADLGIIRLLYLFVKKISDEKKGLLAASIFAFTPAFWYNSAVWGQTDSVFALPMLGAFYALSLNKTKTSLFLIGLSLLTKPTAVFVLPVYLIWFLKKAKLSDFLPGILILLAEIFILFLPFHPSNLPEWILLFYKRTLGGELGYLVANAFNFWALFFGFDNRPDTSLFLGIPANIFGYAAYSVSLGISLYATWKQKADTKLFLLAAVAVTFAAFIFLPRMHERYFYPALISMVPLAAISDKFRKFFWFLSTIHLINLFHFWWVPRLDVFIYLFSINWVEKLLIVANIGLFAAIFFRLLKRQKI